MKTKFSARSRVGRADREQQRAHVETGSRHSHEN